VTSHKPLSLLDLSAYRRRKTVRSACASLRNERRTFVRELARDFDIAKPKIRSFPSRIDGVSLSSCYRAAWFRKPSDVIVDRRESRGKDMVAWLIGFVYKTKVYSE